MDEKKRCAAVCQKNSPALAALPAPMEKRESYVIVKRPPRRGGHSKIRTFDQHSRKTRNEKGQIEQKNTLPIGRVRRETLPAIVAEKAVLERLYLRK